MATNKLTGKKILVTAGPTRESIDGFRFISNHSTGKLGFAIAEEFLQQGAEVCLVSGPTCLQLEHPRLTTVRVQTASEMYLACCHFFEDVDVALFAAAVTEYRPVKITSEKGKPNELLYSVRMKKNIDIAAEFGKVKTDAQLSIGFRGQAKEDHRTAVTKLNKKNLDLLVTHVKATDEEAEGSSRITVTRKDLSSTIYMPSSIRELASDLAYECAIAFSHAELAEWEEQPQAYEVMYS